MTSINFGSLLDVCNKNKPKNYRLMSWHQQKIDLTENFCSIIHHLWLIKKNFQFTSSHNKCQNQTDREEMLFLLLIRFEQFNSQG